MYRQIKIFLNILVFTSLVSASIGQSTRITSDPDADYKLAKELVTQKLNGHISPQINTILRLVQGDVAQNQMKLKLQQDASLPALETMNIIHRQ